MAVNLAEYSDLASRAHSHDGAVRPMSPLEARDFLLERGGAGYPAHGIFYDAFRTLCGDQYIARVSPACGGAGYGLVALQGSTDSSLIRLYSAVGYPIPDAVALGVKDGPAAAIPCLRDLCEEHDAYVFSGPRFSKGCVDGAEDLLERLLGALEDEGFDLRKQQGF